MNYSCSRCGRTFICDETISFCPFCGQAYAAASVGAGVVMQRIVISSDSERIVQEKYWRRAQSNLHSALQHLRHSLPRFAKEREEEETEVPEVYRCEPVHAMEFVDLKRCTSVAAFKGKMGAYLSNLRRAYGIRSELLPIAVQKQQEYRAAMADWRRAMELGKWSADDLEDAYSIDFAREEDFINGFCRDLAETVGCMTPERLQPASEYEPEDIDWPKLLGDVEEGDELPGITPAHQALLDAIDRVAPLVLRLVAENSLFVTSAMVERSSRIFDPAREAEALLSLEKRDYDPIFGESPEPLLEAFSQAVLDMSDFTNSLPDFEEAQSFDPERQLAHLRYELDHIKLRALNASIENWRIALDQELDRAYQRKSENMLDLSNAIETLARRLDEK